MGIVSRLNFTSFFHGTVFIGLATKVIYPVSGTLMTVLQMLVYGMAFVHNISLLKETHTNFRQTV